MAMQVCWGVGDSCPIGNEVFWGPAPGWRRRWWRRRREPASQDFSPRIFVSDSDFIAMTRDGQLCNPAGRLGPAEFERMMREQIRLYAQVLAMGGCRPVGPGRRDDCAPPASLKCQQCNYTEGHSQCGARRGRACETRAYLTRILNPSRNEWIRWPRGTNFARGGWGGGGAMQARLSSTSEFWTTSDEVAPPRDPALISPERLSQPPGWTRRPTCFLGSANCRLQSSLGGRHKPPSAARGSSVGSESDPAAAA